MRSVYLNIGSNKGDRTANIEKAVRMLAEHPLFADTLIRRAPLVYNQPVGYVSDAEFVNLGLAIDFDVIPVAAKKDLKTASDNVIKAWDEEFALRVLNVTQDIEKHIAPDSPHRNPDGTYCDRIVDIDIIAIDGVRMNTSALTLPHPRAAARHFVMHPMAFLAPGWFPDSMVSERPHPKKSIVDMHRDTVDSFKAKKKLPVTVILDNIRSLNNVGSIFRTSDAFCVEHIALCGITASPPAPEIHKTALGAEDSVDWSHHDNTLEAIADLRARGYIITCLEQVHDSISLDDFHPDASARYALVVGNEVNGVDQRVVDAADICLEIPQAGTKHSLNVAVSTAIAVWSFFTSLNRV